MSHVFTPDPLPCVAVAGSDDRFPVHRIYSWGYAIGFDLVFTGTPEGVGPVLRGDRVSAGIEGIGELALRIV